MGFRFGFRYRPKRCSPTTTTAIFISIGSQISERHAKYDRPDCQPSDLNRETLEVGQIAAISVVDGRMSDINA